MKYLSLPDYITCQPARILPFYLAMEEYAACIIGNDDLFFMWQVAPTVIFGRNQLIENEVNIPYCQANGIAYYRRKSGGGCVFADMSNIMLSYITRSDNVQLTFSRYTDAVVDALRLLGLDAHASGRNDILIGECKVSGSAFYHLPGRSIVHGTMLYDSDMTHMAQAITPSRDKLVSKGVSSVPSRITTISRHCDIGIDDFKAHLRNTMCDGEVELTADDISHIEDIMQTYLTEEFIMGNNPRCNIVRQARIDGVGELVVNIELNRNIIKHINIAGDYFLLGDLDGAIIDRITGKPLTVQALTDALHDVDVQNIIMNLKTKQFINLLTN
jgi:lipoyltransferase/lipoate-protein ligase